MSNLKSQRLLITAAFITVLFLACAVRASESEERSLQKAERMVIARAKDFKRIQEERLKAQAETQNELKAFLRLHENDGEEFEHLREAYVSIHPPEDPKREEQMDRIFTAHELREREKDENLRKRYVVHRRAIEKILNGPEKIDEAKEYDVKSVDLTPKS